MFSQEQLDSIKFAAKRTKNQGEMAVFGKLLMLDTMPTFSRTQLDIVKYCAEECKRQMSGEMSVYDMVNAWNFAHLWQETQLDLDFIEEVGRTVEPIDNKKGFRTIPIYVGNGWDMVEKAPYWRIQEMLETLIHVYYNGLIFDQEARDNGWVNEDSIKFKAKNAEDMFYLHYEDIHPFVDGNGRSGKILYNYLNGTLENPIMPPNFWGSSNP